MPFFKLTFTSTALVCLIIFLSTVELASARNSFSFSQSNATNGEVDGEGGDGSGDVLVFGGTPIKVALPTSLVILIVILYKLWKCCTNDGCSFSLTSALKSNAQTSQTEMMMIDGSNTLVAGAGTET